MLQTLCKTDIQKSLSDRNLCQTGKVHILKLSKVWFRLEISVKYVFFFFVYIHFYSTHLCL